MNPTLCSRCKKNVAVIFVTKIENGNTVSDGFCLKCAREMGLKPVDDIISRMGLSEEDLEGLSNEMMDAFQGMEGLMGMGQQTDGDDDEDDIITDVLIDEYKDWYYNLKQRVESMKTAYGI